MAGYRKVPRAKVKRVGWVGEESNIAFGKSSVLKKEG
jgi:hypothetical protein